MGAIDEEGYVRLVDRTTNLIKSRGEWIISSVDLENAITAHPGVAEAAVIGIAHTKKPPPLGGVVLKPGAAVTTEELKGFLKDRVRAAGWIPGEVVLLAQIPKTRVGKFNKKELRKMVAGGHIKIPCQPWDSLLL